MTKCQFYAIRICQSFTGTTANTNKKGFKMEWFLRLIGLGSLLAAPTKAEQFAPVAIPPEEPLGPWDILWNGELHRLKAAYTESWGGHGFFTREVTVKGVELTVVAIKQASTNPEVFFYITRGGGGLCAVIEVQGANTVTRFGPTVSVPTKDVGEAVVRLGEQGHLQNLLT